MSIVSVNSVINPSSSTTSTSSAKDKVAEQKNMFLNLLVKQLQYQDPLNPVQNTEFTAQLAQFSSLDALTDIKESMSNLSQLQSTINNIQALSFIGKSVDAVGNTVNYTGSPVDISFEVGDQAATVDVTIYDEDGKPVRHMQATGVQKGDAKVVWDGKNDGGTALGGGKYYFTVSAKGYDGTAVSSTTYAKGTVTGVRYDSGTVYLEIGDKEVALSDVNKISG
jgi:flagellar basal-body rod modification protein FlgD